MTVRKITAREDPGSTALMWSVFGETVRRRLPELCTRFAYTVALDLRSGRGGPSFDMPAPLGGPLAGAATRCGDDQGGADWLAVVTAMVRRCHGADLRTSNCR